MACMEQGIATIRINDKPPKPTTFEDLGYVQVVRCKDCKYYDGFGCENMKNESMIGMIVADDWFCADGERKDE